MGAVCRRPAVSGAGRVVTDVWFLYGPRRSTIRALLNSSLGEAVWTTQASAVAALTERAGDARRFPALSIASAWKTS